MTAAPFLILVAACSSSAPGGGTPDAGAADRHDARGAQPGDDASREASASSDAGVPDAPPAADADTDTWTHYAQAFVTTYCVECHGPSDPAGNNFTLYSKVYSDRGLIRCGVCVTQEPSWGCAASPVAEQFPISDGKTPPNPKPTDAERDRFVAWINAGAPE